MRPVAGAWTADIAAIGETGHSGFATITLNADGGTRANATLAGGSVGGVHPWAIHAGSCESEGALVGNEEAYPVLEPNERGNASATATLTETLATDEAYALRIYASSEDREAVVGCGDLRPMR